MSGLESHVDEDAACNAAVGGGYVPASTATHAISHGGGHERFLKHRDNVITQDLLCASQNMT